MGSNADRNLPPRITQGSLLDRRGEEVGFRGPQVCKIVGISYRQLDYWARTDLVRPSLADAHGSGTQRRYSYRDLVRLKVIKSLHRRGRQAPDGAQGDRVPTRRPRRGLGVGQSGAQRHRLGARP